MATNNEYKDGSKIFVLQGGPLDRTKVRLYPQDDGWVSVLIGGNKYVAPDDPPAKGGLVLNWTVTEHGR